MFTKIAHTDFPPKDKPVLVWDGDCGFCKFWVTRWKKMSGDKINYRPFQEAAVDFKDIPLKEFKKASRLIETDGRIFSGPDSAYRSYDYSTKTDYPFHNWYVRHNWFAWLSDHGYNWVAKHRGFMFKATHALFGKDPLSLKYYWLIYLILLLLILNVGYL